MSELVIPGSLAEVLFRAQIICEDDIRVALAERERAGCRFGEALVKLGIVTEEDIEWALSHQLDIPYIRLTREMIFREAAALLPEHIARRHLVVPLIMTGNELRVAMSDPLDREALAAFEESSGCTVAVSIARSREIRDMLDFLYGPEQEKSFGFSTDEVPGKELDAINADPAGDLFLGFLLTRMVRQRLSSISLLPMHGTIAVTGRRGDLDVPVGVLAYGRYDQFMKRVCSLAGVGEFAGTSAEGAFSYPCCGRAVPFRALFLRGAQGMVTTFQRQTVAHTLAPEETLAVQSGLEERFRELGGGHGLVIFAVPRDDERYRLMELFLASCDTEAKRVLLFGEGFTVGRMRFPCVPLRSRSGEDAATVFAAGLDHEPHIMMIDDAMDNVLLREAGRAALGGRLVCAGLSIDLELALKFLLPLWHGNLAVPAVIRGVVSGRGVTTLCPDCREALPLTPEEAAVLRLPEAASGYFHAPGCETCEFTGQGTTRSLFDIILFDPEVADAVESARSSRDLLHYLAGRGLYRLPEQVTAWLVNGEISPEEFVAVSRPWR